MDFYLLLNTKEDILKDVENLTVLVSIDFYSIFVHTMEVNGNRNCQYQHVVFMKNVMQVLNIEGE